MLEFVKAAEYVPSDSILAMIDSLTVIMNDFWSLGSENAAI